MASTTIFRLRFNRNYTTFVKTSHGHVKVDFTPIVLFGRTENSQFGTVDPEVIEGLKKHPFFGSLFYVEEEGREAPAESAVPAAAVPESGRQAEGVGNTDGKPDAKGEKNAAPAAEKPADEEEIPAAKNPVPEKEVPAAEKTQPESDAEADTLTHEKTVTSKNKAIAYLLDKHGATFSQTTDIPKMKEEARVVYKLEFDNWK